VVWITLVWVLLWGEVTVASVLTGALVGLVIQTLLPLPTVHYHGRLHVKGLVVLVARFTVDLFAASFQVARLALDPRRSPRGGVVEITSLVPGSVAVEALRSNGMLYVHVLDMEGAGGPDQVRRDVLAIEERVFRALASDREREAAGLGGDE
jgi:multicomponent Na+:H+ antiporter subunit E